MTDSVPSLSPPTPEVPDAQRPASFTVDYRGGQVVFSRLPDGQGYGYQRVEGGPFHWIDTESGTRHKLSFNAEGKATVVGSLGPMNGDGFHTVIENGVMRDV